MSTAQQAQCFDKAMEITDLYLRNARGKLGVAESPPKPPTTAEPPSSGSPVATTAAAGLPSWVKAAAAGVAVLSGAGGLAGLASYFAPRTATTVIEQPADPSGSLLQNLQDGGFHLPEGKK